MEIVRKGAIVFAALGFSMLAIDRFMLNFGPRPGSAIRECKKATSTWKSLIGG